MTVEAQSVQTKVARKTARNNKAVEQEPDSLRTINLWDERAAKGDAWYRKTMLKKKQRD